jgi:two-component system NtrC family response regulator
MASVLIIDDDKMICEGFRETIELMGHNVQYATNLNDGLELVRSELFDVVFLDVRLPDGNGLRAIPEIREQSPAPAVIIITGEGTPDSAEMAIKSGCWEYIQKPISAKVIELSLFRVLQYRNERKIRALPVSLKREGIIGSSPQLKKCLDLVARAGDTDMNVFITGETGTGKELFARAIHINSQRDGGEFVAVDCASLPEALVESMLFGHERGAFTGAEKSRQGMIKQADGGTLFLDEIGELPLNVQSGFLRVLQERSFRTIGGNQEIKSDFRLITATNRNLDQMVKNSRFRQDLLFRLKSLEIELPPLRKRKNDIIELSFYYMSRFCDRYGLGTKGFSPEFLEALNAYPWPGNVRELINALEYSVSAARFDQTLFPIHLPDHIRTQTLRESVEPGYAGKFLAERDTNKIEEFNDHKTMIEITERKYFQDLVAITGGNVKDICRISRLSRAQVYRLLKKYDITRQF